MHWWEWSQVLAHWKKICCLYLWVPRWVTSSYRYKASGGMSGSVPCGDCKWLRLLPYAFLNSNNSQEVENTEVTVKLPVFPPKLNFWQGGKGVLESVLQFWRGPVGGTRAWLLMESGCAKGKKMLIVAPVLAFGWSCFLGDLNKNPGLGIHSG